MNPATSGMKEREEEERSGLRQEIKGDICRVSYIHVNLRKANKLWANILRISTLCGFEIHYRDRLQWLLQQKTFDRARKLLNIEKKKGNVRY